MGLLSCSFSSEDGERAGWNFLISEMHRLMSSRSGIFSGSSCNLRRTSSRYMTQASIFCWYHLVVLARETPSISNLNQLLSPLPPFLTSNAHTIVQHIYRFAWYSFLSLACHWQICHSLPLTLLQPSALQSQRMAAPGSKPQLILREDLHQISHFLSQKPQNVLAHKRLKQFKPYASIDTPPPQHTPTIQVNLAEDRHTPHKDKLCTTQADERPVKTANKAVTLHHTLQTPQDAKKTRTNFRHRSSGSTPRSNQQATSHSADHKKASQRSDIAERIQQRANKLTKASNRLKSQSSLQPKHLVNWLNQILLDYCFDAEDRLEAGRMKALERFGLDPSALLSRGVKIEDVQGLYRGLFVYSMGFNDMLRGISKGKDEVMKSVWKVYAILLQFCSQGSFETMMGELERDMIRNEERLIGEIEQRQKLIDSSEDVMEARLSKLLRENRDYQHKVGELGQQNTILEKELKEIEMAYYTEVELRLTYQHNISKIHAVHEQLNHMHVALYRDFQEAKEGKSKLKEQFLQQGQHLRQVKSHHQQQFEEISDLHRKMKEYSAVIEGLQLNEKEMKCRLKNELGDKKQELLVRKEQDRKISQLMHQIDSGNIMVALLKQTAEANAKEYHLLVEENIELRESKVKRLQQINELLNEVNFLRSQQTSLRHELQPLKKQVSELKAEKKKLQTHIKQLQVTIQKKNIDIETIKLQASSKAELVTDMNEAIAKMKKGYAQMEDEMAHQKRINQHLRKQVDDFHAENMEKNLENKNMKDNKFELELQISRLENQMQLAEKRSNALLQEEKRKYNKIHAVCMGQHTKEDDLLQQLKANKKAHQQTSERVSFLTTKFTEVNFAKTEIENKYSDMLYLHQQEKTHEREMMIELVTTKDLLTEEKTNHDKAVRTYSKKVEKLEEYIQKLKQQLSEANQKIKAKGGWVHPMRLEDAEHQLLRLFEELEASRAAWACEKEEMEQRADKRERELLKQRDGAMRKVFEAEKREQKLQKQLQSERGYFSSKTEQLNSTILDLQTRLQCRQVDKMVQIEAEAAEKKYQSIISDKNSQIEQIIEQLQRIQNSYSQQNKINQETILDLSQRIVSLEEETHQEKVEMKEVMQEERKQLEEIIEEKEKEKEELIIRKVTREEMEARIEKKKAFEDKRKSFIRKFKLVAKDPL